MNLFTSWLSEAKAYILGLLALGGAVLVGMFVYEKNKAEIDDALLKENKVNQDLSKDNAQVKANNDQIAASQADVQKLEKQNETPSNVVSFLNNRK